MVWRPLRILAVFLVVGLLVGLAVVGPQRPEVSMNPARRGTFSAQSQPPAGAQVVRIGFYPVAVYNLDQASNTFYADAYVWLKWKGEIDPTATLEFVKEPLGNERSRRVPGFDLCLLNILDAVRK